MMISGDGSDLCTKYQLWYGFFPDRNGICRENEVDRTYVRTEEVLNSHKSSQKRPRGSALLHETGIDHAF